MARGVSSEGTKLHVVVSAQADEVRCRRSRREDLDNPNGIECTGRHGPEGHSIAAQHADPDVSSGSDEEAPRCVL